MGSSEAFTTPEVLGRHHLRLESTRPDGMVSKKGRRFMCCQVRAMLTDDTTGPRHCFNELSQT